MMFLNVFSFQQGPGHKTDEYKIFRLLKYGMCLNAELTFVWQQIQSLNIESDVSVFENHETKWMK